VSSAQAALIDSDTIPKPAAIALFGLVLAGVGLARRRTGSSVFA